MGPCRPNWTRQIQDRILVEGIFPGERARTHPQQAWCQEGKCLQRVGELIPHLERKKVKVGTETDVFKKPKRFSQGCHFLGNLECFWRQPKPRIWNLEKCISVLARQQGIRALLRLLKSHKDTRGVCQLLKVVQTAQKLKLDFTHAFPENVLRNPVLFLQVANRKSVVCCPKSCWWLEFCNLQVRPHWRIHWNSACVACGKKERPVRTLQILPKVAQFTEPEKCCQQVQRLMHSFEGFKAFEAKAWWKGNECFTSSRQRTLPLRVCWRCRD